MVRPAATILLFLNLVLYFIIIVIAGWLADQAIEDSLQKGRILRVPARIFPIYFPNGNTASGFFVIFSLIAAAVGLATSITGLSNVVRWSGPALHTAVASSLITWALALLTMGLACQEISIGLEKGSYLRTLEIITIAGGATQSFCAAVLHVGLREV